MQPEDSQRKPYAFVVFSHGSYTDVWPLLIASYEKYLGGDLFDFYITSDSTNGADILDGTEFQMLKYDSELSWTDAFIQCTEGLEYQKVLFSFDDLILKAPVDVESLTAALQQTHYDYLKTICSHVRFFDRVFRTGRYFDVNQRDSYRGSLVFSLLSKELLRKITREPGVRGLSAWQYERMINQFLDNSMRYGCVRQNIFRFENLVIKGRVNPVAKWKLARAANLKYSGSRPSQSFGTSVSYHSKLIFFTIIKYFIPTALFAYFRAFKDKMLKLVGRSV